MFGNPASKCWRLHMLHEVTQSLTACLLFQLHGTLVSSFSNLKDPGSSEGAPEEAAASGVAPDSWCFGMILFLWLLASNTWQCSIGASTVGAEEEPRSRTPGNAEVWQPSFARGHSWPHRPEHVSHACYMLCREQSGERGPGGTDSCLHWCCHLAFNCRSKQVNFRSSMQVQNGPAW